MSQKETESNSTENASRLEVISKEGNDFIVKVSNRETFLKIEDIYAEMFLSLVTSPEI